MVQHVNVETPFCICNQHQVFIFYSTDIKLRGAKLQLELLIKFHSLLYCTNESFATTELFHLYFVPELRFQLN